MHQRPLRLLHETLVATAAREPDKTALIVDGRTYSYRKLLEGARRLASALRAGGVKRGDRVAIFMENSAECVLSVYATALAGAVFVVINPQTKQDKLAGILADCEAVLLLTEGQLARTFVPAAESTSTKSSSR